jgi:hypothetical protein
VDPYEHPLAEAPTPASTAGRVPDTKPGHTDLEVINIRIARNVTPPAVTGIVRNNTDDKVDSAEVTYYLADDQGSLLATESADVRNLGAHDSTSFSAPLKTVNAEFVLVRDVRPN